jgi:hypothetical protein
MSSAFLANAWNDMIRQRSAYVLSRPRVSRLIGAETSKMFPNRDCSNSGAIFSVTAKLNF